ncbi:MAG TPA: YkgJ family cysteine cluster protein [Polyangiaceae bacterium]
MPYRAYTHVTSPEVPDNPEDGEDDSLDCLACGACCRTGEDGRILIPAADLVRWRRIGRTDLTLRIQPGHFGLDAFATNADGSCTHLGTRTEPNACQIYEERGTTCREFVRGSPQCLEFRRDFGVTVKKPADPVP